jgi:hypothetical protein
MNATQAAEAANMVDLDGDPTGDRSGGNRQAIADDAHSQTTP